MRTRRRRIPDLQRDEHGDHATAPGDLDASRDRRQDSGRSCATCWWRPVWWGWSAGSSGSALGVLIGRQAIGALPAGLLQGYETRTEYILPGYAIPVAVAACIAVSVAAAALAARQVYKVAPVEALAPVGASAADAVPRTARVVAGVLGVCLRRDGGLRRIHRPGQAFGGGDRARGCSAISLCASPSRARSLRAAAAVARALRGARRAGGGDDRTRAAPGVGDADDGDDRGVDHRAEHRRQRQRDRFDERELRLRSATSHSIVSPSGPGVFPTAPMLPQDTRVLDRVDPRRRRSRSGADGIRNARRQPGHHPGARARRGRAAVARHESRKCCNRCWRETAWSSPATSPAPGNRAGDELTLPTPTGEQRVRVLEVVPFFSLLGGVVSMSLPQLRQWFDRPGSTILAVKLAPGADRAEVEAAIRDELPADVLRVLG